MNRIHGNKVGTRHKYVGSIGAKISYSSTHKIVEEVIEKDTKKDSNNHIYANSIMEEKGTQIQEIMLNK
jgi:hypothetical protein